MATTETLAGLDLRDALTLLDASYAEHHQARELKARGLVTYNEGQLRYDWTAEGEATVELVRRRYGMTFDESIAGGGRWVVAGKGLHCGDALELLLDDGRWQPVRFEVDFGGDRNVRGGRRPVLHVGIAGGGSLECHVEVERAVFRWPKRH